MSLKLTIILQSVILLLLFPFSPLQFLKLTSVYHNIFLHNFALFATKIPKPISLQSYTCLNVSNYLSIQNMHVFCNQQLHIFLMYKQLSHNRL